MTSGKFKENVVQQGEAIEVDVESEEELRRREELEKEEEEILIKRMLMEPVLRVAEMISRFAEFRLRELFAQGIRVHWDVKREVEEDYLRMVIEIRIPPSLVELAKKRKAELIGYLVNKARTARKNDRYKYRFREFEDAA